VDEDGRVVPCDGVFGRVVVWLPPVPVDGLAWAGASASDGFVLLEPLVFGPDPVTPVEPLGLVDPCPGVDGRCCVTVWPLRLLDGGSATR
jgi:hypothetical protein